MTRHHDDYFDSRHLLDKFGEAVDDSTIASALGVNRSTIRAWRYGKRYRLDPFRADRYALRIGLHPCAVWPDWWEKALQAA